MPLRAEIHAAPALERLHELRADLPDYRRQLTRVVMREVLRRTIARHPVDTGRSRAAWSAALTQLGGTPPAGYQGNNPAAIAEGAGLSTTAESHHDAAATLDVTSHVDYIPFVEYGTRNQPARQMVQRSLEETAQALQQIAPPIVATQP
jgi:hypothetical protein